MNLFDWLKHINQYKTPIEKFKEKDWESFNSYMIHRFISMNKEFIEVVNYVQELPPQEKKMIYNVYREFIPKNNKWNKYIKSTNKEPNKELISILKDHFNLSTREIKDYLKILDKQEIIRILSNRGLEQKEIKQLIK
jgi:hypothetical protein